MDRKEAIEVLKKNYPDICYTMLREAVDMAIEALKTQDVVEELTQDLADRLNDAYAAGYSAAKREIALSGEYERAYQRGKADATKWIPCSERLPETIGEYLITALSRPSRNAIASAGYWNERLKEFGTFRPDGTWEKWDVVAWKPLPEPYNAESEGEDDRN